MATLQRLTLWLAVALTAYVAGALAQAPNYYVSYLPFAASSPKSSKHLDSYSGYIASGRNGSTAENMFFWLVPSLRKSPELPSNLVIWLNGGPGCSSMDGFFLEIGPWRFQNTSEPLGLQHNPFGWHESVDVLFVDQPVGTGFSFSTNETEFAHNQDEMAQNFLSFFIDFVKLFPQYRNYNLWLAGESYAGIYIPYIATAMLQAPDAPAKLAGLLIGNGWIDPMNQYPAYIDFAVANGLLSGNFLTDARQKEAQCIAALRAQQGTQSVITNPVCESIVDYVTAQSTQGKKPCLNLYDIRYTDDADAPADSCGMAWPRQLKQVQKYLNTDQVRAALHVSPNSLQTNATPPAWKECENKVSKNFNGQTSAPSVVLLPSLLQKVKVLLFNGDKDFLCNYIGTEYMIGNLSWNGAQGFDADTKTYRWLVNGSVAGQLKTSRNLTYLRVFNSSHMVPYDWPAASLSMLNLFLDLPVSAAGADGTLIDSSQDTSGDESSHGGRGYFTSGYFTLGLVFLLLMIVAVLIGLYIHFQDHPRIRSLLSKDKRYRLGEIEQDPFLQNDAEFNFDSSVHMDSYPTGK